MSFVAAMLVGCVTGVLSGFGIGGGTLLMIYMTAFAGIGQLSAQGINLLYFLPTSSAALYSHIKNKFVNWQAAIPAIIAGCVCSLAAALAATAIDVSFLKKLFGLFLIYIGFTELFKKTDKPSKKSKAE